MVESLWIIWDVYHRFQLVQDFATIHGIFWGRIGGRNIGNLINIGDLISILMWDSIINKICKFWVVNWIGFPSLVLSKLLGVWQKSFLFTVSVAVPALIGWFPLDWIPCRNQAAQIPHGKMYFRLFFITQFGFERMLSFDPKDWDIFVSSSLFYRHIMTWQISQHVLNMPTIFIYIPVLVELISSLSTFSNRSRQGIPCYRNHHGPSPGTLSSASRGPTTPVACQKSPVPWELQDSAARAFWRSGKVSKIHTDPKGDSFWNWEFLSMYKPLEGGRFELLSIISIHFPQMASDFLVTFPIYLLLKSAF